MVFDPAIASSASRHLSQDSSQVRADGPIWGTPGLVVHAFHALETTQMFSKEDLFNYSPTGGITTQQLQILRV